MKPLRVLAVLMVISLAFTGCNSRNRNNNASSSAPSVVSKVEEGLDDLKSNWEEAKSDVEDALDISEHDGEYELSREDDLFDTSDDERSGLDEDRSDREDSILDHESSLANEISEEEAAATMSTDFSQIGALSAEKKGWGPGGPVDAKNRPDGATVYQSQYGEYGAHFIAPDNNKIYLTFDEGYENGYTAQILDTLKEKNVKAVFFITYDYAKTEVELVKRMVEEGHILGNHSTKHPSFPDLTLEEAKADIQNLHDYVKANYGYEMSLFRPPMGEFSEQVLALVQSMGYKSVFWSVAYRDWVVDDQPITIEALNTLNSRCHPGAIYLLHAVSQTNAEILDDFIDAGRAAGYEFAKWDLY